MFKICNICLKTDTRGNKMISIEISALDRIAEGVAGARPQAPDLDHLRGEVRDVGIGPDLQPTNYCTSMWNGIRCRGDHDLGATWHAGGQLDNGGYLRMWQDGQDGVDMAGPAELWNFNDLDFELGWSALDQMHAEARDGSMCDCNCKADRPCAADIEIYEFPSVQEAFPDAADWIPVRPRHIRINGIQYMTPVETPVEVDDLLMVDSSNFGPDGEVLEPGGVRMPVVTVTLFVADLRIAHSFSGRKPRPDDGEIHAAYLELVDTPSSLADHVRKVIGGVYLNGERVLLKGEPSIQILDGGLVLARLPLLVHTLKVHGG